MANRDERSKEQLKRDGDYTPDYWRKLKQERGWSTEKHGQKPPRKGRTDREHLSVK